MREICPSRSGVRRIACGWHQVWDSGDNVETWLGDNRQQGSTLLVVVVVLQLPTNQPTHSHLPNFRGSWNCHFSSWLSDNGLVVASLLLTPYLASHKTYEVNTVPGGRVCGTAGPTIAKSQPAWILIKFFGQWDHILKLFCSRNQTFVLFSSQFNALVSWIL